MKHKAWLVDEVLPHTGRSDNLVETIYRRYRSLKLDPLTAGRIDRSSLDLRREIQEGLSVVETWNSTNSLIFYGRGSEIASNDRQAQELSVLAMHLLQVSMVYINTLMIQEVLAQPAWHNWLEPEDLRALTPLIYAHVNPYGRFELDLEERLAFEA